MKKFSSLIIKNLEVNGFPQKKVSLPTEKMYEIADAKGHSLNTVLKYLEEECQIQSTIKTEKIIFEKKVESTFEDLQNNPAFMEQAQDMMSKMDPTELQKIQEQIMNMTPEQKEEMLRQAKNMGLF